mmetsp:Transcript_9081/g.1341  ORF Transcript_9081/g.1341 Transcript_9081/m.1341 type:complete len:168 (+) Transcript_9081:6801-7304(+)|eukprot:CAMPEP_0168313236 /NCGR_PEP_ID=MMETSP0210-20121227/593_1 /TAXON_ID=40633 /ORGANISM="Condylostoma magnum, Strain COL2" /LENGTH=167 /DNA_ID=CAMNT_0008267299 /DNA_START=9371 /DNA_END=9874 /DNA_ORIENTATION=-
MDYEKSSFLGKIYELTIYASNHDANIHSFFNICRLATKWDYNIKVPDSNCIDICGDGDYYVTNACATTDTPFVTPEDWKANFMFNTDEEVTDDEFGNFSIWKGFDENTGDIDDPDFDNIELGYVFNGAGEKKLTMAYDKTYQFGRSFSIYAWVKPAGDGPILEKKSL